LSYIYDPANPVQTIGGNNLLIPCGPLDQRPIEKAKRQDVLIFTTPVLTEPVALAGLLQSTIFFSTNVTDTDIIVKLIDVYPSDDPKDPLLAGESVLVADGISRARWRNFPYSNDPAPLSGNPSDTYEVNISLWSTAYVFAAGHSIRVHVSSSNYPRFYPNSNTGTPMNATQGIANITASTTIYLGTKGNSHFTFPVVDLASLPGFPVEDAVTSMLSRYEESWTANVRSREAGDVDLRTWLLRRLSKAWEAMTKGA
jgi:putative CocE/NonD family hydrolase